LAQYQQSANSQVVNVYQADQTNTTPSKTKIPWANMATAPPLYKPKTAHYKPT
jgi:hypothetical protein